MDASSKLRNIIPNQFRALKAPSGSSLMDPQTRFVVTELIYQVTGGRQAPNRLLKNKEAA
jgi:hypothetical protein